MAGDARGFDVAVVGAGVQGMATACRLSKRGLSVVILDRFGRAAVY